MIVVLVVQQMDLLCQLPEAQKVNVDFPNYIKLAFRAPMAPYSRPSGLYRAVYYVLEKHFPYTNLHRANLNILHRGILNT